MYRSNERVKALVREIRKRWKRRALMQGTALSLLTVIFSASILLLLHLRFEASSALLAVLAGLGGITFLVIAFLFIIRPAFKRLSDRQVILYVEEKIPELEDRLNAAIDFESQSALRFEQSILIDRLIDDASNRARMIPVTTLIDRKKERILTYTSAAFLVLFLVFGYTSLEQLRYAVASVDLTTLTAPAKPLMQINPGNIEIEKGESQEVIVELREKTQRDVVLHYKVGDGAWEKAPMKGALDEPAFLHEFLDIQEPIQYFAEFDENRSEPFTISLYEFPRVAQIDLQYRFPSYTGLPPRIEEDMGDIYGLKGSTVVVTVHTTGTVEEGTLMLNGDQSVPLKAAGDGRFTANIPLNEPGMYYVSLTDRAGKHNKFPEEYQIEPVEDERPLITITDPQKDVRANAIEEVLVAVNVQDDYGVKDARLRFSVNGEQEQTIPFTEASQSIETEVTGEHLFFLEDYGLEPGDVISYYIEAEDHFHTDAPEATDMYFIEVIPFDQRFSQVNNMGSGMQGGQASGIVLTQQQIIAATWKLHRERKDMTEEAFQEANRGLVQAQANLKGEIERRINTTAFSVELQTSEENRKIVDYLRKATGEMDLALKELSDAALEEALTPERKALNHLLRADALNKEQRVAMGQQQGSMGGSTEERMTELMDLELDISKDKYEMQQQPQGQAAKQEVDEALEKVRELARKQQNLVNQGQQQDLKGEDKKRFIDRLKRDQDELTEQSQSLAQNMRQMARGNEQMSRQMQERMERISENMRQAEQALRKGDVQEAMAKQQQALNELNRLQQQLRLANTDNTREMLDQLTENLEQLKDQEEQIGRDIQESQRKANAQGGRPDRSDLERLTEKRQGMQENLQGIEEQLKTLEERAAGDDAELSRAARNLARRLQQEDLERAMEESESALRRGWLDQAQRIEEDIQDAMERMDPDMRELSGRLPVTQEEQLARSLEEVRDLMREMEEMMERGQQPGGQSSPQQGQSSQQQGQSSSQQEGQSGQQGQSEGQGSGGQGGDRQQQANAARMQERLRDARESLERLQRDLDGNPNAQAMVQGLQNALGRADHTGQRLSGDAAKEFFNEEVYQPLSQLEMELVRQLDVIEMEKKLYGARRADVPPEYREILEKYYESLAKTRE